MVLLRFWGWVSSRSSRSNSLRDLFLPRLYNDAVSAEKERKDYQTKGYKQTKSEKCRYCSFWPLTLKLPSIIILTKLKNPIFFGGGTGKRSRSQKTLMWKPFQPWVPIWLTAFKLHYNGWPHCVGDPYCFIMVTWSIWMDCCQN